MSISRFVVDHIHLTTTKPFDQVKADFERQHGKFDADAYRSLAVGENAETVRARIAAMAGPNGFMAFATHDHGALLRIVGLMHKAVPYVVGNPLYAVHMKQHALGASLSAPLRVLLSTRTTRARSAWNMIGPRRSLGNSAMTGSPR